MFYNLGSLQQRPNFLARPLVKNSTLGNYFLPIRANMHLSFRTAINTHTNPQTTQQRLHWHPTGGCEQTQKILHELLSKNSSYALVVDNGESMHFGGKIKPWLKITTKVHIADLCLENKRPEREMKRIGSWDRRRRASLANLTPKTFPRLEPLVGGVWGFAAVGALRGAF